MTSSMPLTQPDSLQLVRELMNSSPADMVMFYTGTSASAEVEADPAVRVYANVLRRLCLCFNHWDADWRDLIPGLRNWVATWGCESSLKSAHATVLKALIARAATVDAAKGLPPGGDATPVGNFLRSLSPNARQLGNSILWQYPLQDKAQSFLSACAAELGAAAATATIVDELKIFVDHDLLTAPPSGVNLKAGATTVDNVSTSGEGTSPKQTAPELPAEEDVEATGTQPVEADDNVLVDNAKGPPNGDHTGTTAVTTAASDHGAFESVVTPPSADLPGPVVPAPAEPAVPAAPAVPTTCPTCYELIPEDLPEREKKYTPDDLAAHNKAWHSDYATVRMWCDNQKKIVRGSPMWACPSRRCFLVIKKFEKHVSDFHTHDGTVCAEYLVLILSLRIRNGERSFPVQHKLTVAKQTLAAEQRGNIARLEAFVKEWEGREDGAKEGEKQVQVTTAAGTTQKKHCDNSWNKMMDRMNAKAAKDLLSDLMADADRRRFGAVHDTLYGSPAYHAASSASPYFSNNAEAGPSTLHQALDLASKDSEAASGADKSAGNDAAKDATDTANEDATTALSPGDKTGAALTTTSNPTKNDTMEIDELDADADAGVKAENMDVD